MTPPNKEAAQSERERTPYPEITSRTDRDVLQLCAKFLEDMHTQPIEWAAATSTWLLNEVSNALSAPPVAEQPRKKFELTPEIKEALAKAAETRSQIAEMPKGGIMFINYGDQPEDDADLNCPYCGGSGHKDDVAEPVAAPAQACQHHFVRDYDAIQHECCQKCGEVRGPSVSAAPPAAQPTDWWRRKAIKLADELGRIKMQAAQPMTEQEIHDLADKHGAYIVCSGEGDYSSNTESLVLFARAIEARKL